MSIGFLLVVSGHHARNVLVSASDRCLVDVSLGGASDAP
jgi:hypothetical protein